LLRPLRLFRPLVRHDLSLPLPSDQEIHGPAAQGWLNQKKAAAPVPLSSRRRLQGAFFRNPALLDPFACC
jgi:hypothetical protein